MTNLAVCFGNVEGTMVNTPTSDRIAQCVDDEIDEIIFGIIFSLNIVKCCFLGLLFIIVLDAIYVENRQKIKVNGFNSVSKMFVNRNHNEKNCLLILNGRVQYLLDGEVVTYAKLWSLVLQRMSTSSTEDRRPLCDMS